MPKKTKKLPAEWQKNEPPMLQGKPMLQERGPFWIPYDYPHSPEDADKLFGRPVFDQTLTWKMFITIFIGVSSFYEHKQGPEDPLFCVLEFTQVMVCRYIYISNSQPTSATVQKIAAELVPMITYWKGLCGGKPFTELRFRPFEEARDKFIRRLGGDPSEYDVDEFGAWAEIGLGLRTPFFVCLHEEGKKKPVAVE